MKIIFSHANLFPNLICAKQHRNGDYYVKKFVKYVSQNMLGMVGMSVYILADTYFISVAVGTDGITALNLVLPVYNMIFAIGAMMGVGSAIRLVIERNQEHPNADGYFSMHCHGH